MASLVKTDKIQSTAASSPEITLPAGSTGTSWYQGRNYLINGNFDVWQRGTSFAAMTQSYTNYQADRWQITPSGNSAVMTVSRQAFTAGQTDVPNNPLYYCRCDVTTAASSAANGEWLLLKRKICLLLLQTTSSAVAAERKVFR